MFKKFSTYQKFKKSWKLSPTIFKPGFENIITKATMMHHLTPKKYTLMDQFFFQNRCWFISEHYSASLTKPNNPFKRYRRFDISEHYGMPGMPDHSQEKPYDQIVSSMDILLHFQSHVVLTDTQRELLCII